MAVRDTLGNVLLVGAIVAAGGAIAARIRGHSQNVRPKGNPDWSDDTKAAIAASDTARTRTLREFRKLGGRLPTDPA